MFYAVEILSHKKPLAIDESCAFSIICRERVVDFYAADLKSRNAWLRENTTQHNAMS